jgi:hypothetical protein
MADLRRWSGKPRSVAAAVVLQLYAGVDPDHSRDLADRIVSAVDRAGMRDHTDAAPTADEVARACNELHRRGFTPSSEDVRAALEAAFVRGWGS